jgi:Ca-activated chloride channel family protein
MHRSPRLTKFLPILLFAAALLPAQEPGTPAPEEPITTIKLQTRIVGVSAIAVDKKGQPVTGLTRNDFVLKEDGVPQTIRYFSQGSDLPLTLALLVDTSGSQTGYVRDEIKASRAFFPAMLLKPEDRAVLVQFDNDVRRLQVLTNRVDQLNERLNLLSEPNRSFTGRGGTLLYDAIYLTSRALLRNEEGRRAMVLLTDGGDNGSHYSLAQAIGEAQRQDIVIYSIYYGEDSHGKKILKTISDYTGGRAFEVSHKTPLADIYAQIAEDMRLQYQLGYTPPEAQVGSYHLIDLTPVDKKLTIVARKGYYTTDAQPKPASTAASTASKP